MHEGFGDPVADEWVLDLDELPHDLVVLPEGLEGDVGIYREDLLAFPKLMRADGLDAGFLHDPEHRRFSGRKGDPILVPVVIAFVVNVVTTGAGIAIQHYIERRFPDRTVKVKVIHRERRLLTGRRDVFEATGTGPEVAGLYREYEASRADPD